MTSSHLPPHVLALLSDWELEPDGNVMRGHTAVVVPVQTAGGTTAVLKVIDAGPEDRHEILGLQTWAGDGVVRLLRGDPRRGAMVLERAGPHDLRTVDDIEA